ncbi:MAG: MaoC family dehydratase [Sphingomonadales bacterium]
MSDKANKGNFFEDFRVGQTIRHATPRTLNDGDASLYTALYGSRFPVTSSAEFARTLGLPGSPMDDLLVFHIVFGKTVPDISLNAVANLGYADCRFLKPVYAGDTLATTSEVIGLKQNSNGKTGVVYVRSTGLNQRGEVVLEYVRWVMVRKGNPDAPAPETVVPDLPELVPADRLVVPDGLDFSRWDGELAGVPYFWNDYAAGERIDHVDGITIEAADHMMATRAYQNTARVHFNLHAEREGWLGERIVYGGHVISLARALSFNGLGAATFIAAINGGQHTAPCIAGDTVYAWSEVLDKAPLTGRSDAGTLRLRLVATKNRSSADFPDKGEGGKRDSAVVLDLDYWAILPRRP